MDILLTAPSLTFVCQLRGLGETLKLETLTSLWANRGGLAVKQSCSRDATGMLNTVPSNIQFSSA